MSLNSNALLQVLTSATEDTTKTTKLAIIKNFVNDEVIVQFFGETESSQKSYKKVYGLGTLSKGQKVILTKINNSYIITGRIQ